MKSVVNELNEQKYPCLKISDDKLTIVLFVASSCGTKVGGNGAQQIGHYSERWAENNFTPFVGEITLSN